MLGNYEEFRDASNNVMRRLHYIHSPYGLVAVVEKTPATQYNTRYITTDYLGSIDCITDDAGNVLQQVSFDAWGRRRDPQTWALYQANAPLTPTPSALYFGRGYTGHEHLEKFDLINMNGRMYDPTLCRMLSVDNYNNNVSSTIGMNRYAYALNNPLKYTDPSGHVILVDDIIIGAVVGGIINVGIQGFSGNINSFGDLGTAFGIGALAGAGGAFVGGAVAGAAGTSGFAAGATTGAASGFASGFIGSAGNSWMNGANFGQGLMAGVEGGAAGAITGGIIGGGLGTIGSNYTIAEDELTSNTTESGDLLACNCGGGGGGGNGGKGPKTHVSKRRLVPVKSANVSFNPFKTLPPNYYLGLFTYGFVGASYDFINNYQSMIEANWKNSDKYFHAKANFQATHRGPGGEFFAEHFSNLREVFDQRIKGDSRQDSMSDQTANVYGRNQAKLFNSYDFRKAMKIYRPPLLPTKY